MTTLTYMQDFDVLTGTARVLSVSTLDDGRKDIVLDETCFYPRGGGQDWDTGQITTNDATFDIEEVRLDEHGDAHHIGTFTGTEFGEGATISSAVDVQRRTLNTRLHSAGHILDMAVDELQLPWVPGKGAHYPHMSNVEYTSDFSAEEASAQAAKIEELCNRFVSEGGTNELRFMQVSEMHTVCRHVPDNLPTNKPARVVIYRGNFGVPCSGTHVRELRDVGEITITKIKAKKGVVKVSYAIAGQTSVQN